jgi:hypothetical protein
MRTADKKHRYHPVLGGDDVNVFMRFVAFFVVEKKIVPPGY